MLTFVNRITGRTVRVSEPDERRAELEAVTRMGRPLSRDVVLVETKRRAKTLEKLAASWKWQRVNGSPTVEPTRPEPQPDPSSNGADAPAGLEVREAGGGWYELVDAAGEVRDKVRGREAAEQAAAELAGV